MALSCKLFLAIMALLTLRCFAHWRLTKPVPRSGGAYENNPLSPDANTKEEWVCRNASPNPNVKRPTFEAGKPTGIVYGTGAIGHVGDCAVYISYDTTWPRRMMRWVKIANLPDCRKQINQLVEIVVPSVLPAGDAVFRWDQAALHQIHNNDPFVEWFIQCADIAITSSSARSWDSFNSFSMIDNNGTPAYPASVNNYRRHNLASVNDADFWMTGPACVDDSVNQCSLTAVGTQGYTGFGGESGGTVTSSPSPATGYDPTPTSTTSVRYPTSTSNARSSMSEIDAMCCYDPSCSTYATSFCNAVGSWCSGSVDACKICGGTLCVESPGGAPMQVHSEQQSDTEAEPEPEPEQDLEPQPDAEAEGEPELEPEPVAEPEPEPEPMTGVTALAPSHPSPSAAGAECCFYGGCSSYGTSFCYAEGLWCAGSALACASCGGAWCTDVSLLSTEHGRQRKFLRKRSFSGNALVQTNASFQKAETTYFTFDADEL